MNKHHDKDAVGHAADLRDAAINFSSAAWRITGLDACSLIKSGDEYGRALSPEELACASADSFGWATLGETARRIADAWARAAEAWQAADAHVHVAKSVAVAELKRQHRADAEITDPPPQAEVENGRWPTRPEAFRITTGRSYRSARRPTIHRSDASAD